MKIVNIIGGLGNQMLEYSFALSLQKRNPEEKVLLDISHFKGYALHNGFEIDNIFGCQLPFASRKDIRQVSRYMPNYKLSRIIRHLLPNKETEIVENWKKEYGFYIERYLRQEGDAYYDGYWHSPYYYEGTDEIIRSALKFPPFNDEYNKKMVGIIKNSESICVHVRRGDYVGHSFFDGICTDDYYKKAIDQAVELSHEPTIFVFSNDIDYCKNMLSCYAKKCEIVYVDHNSGSNSYCDMQLMSFAKTNIIANSTFSWWSAWLNVRDEHSVFCPSKWVTYCDTPDIYPSSWIKI